MGYNTVAFMLNDMAHELEREPHLGIFLNGCMASGSGGAIGQRIKVLPSQHADYDQIIMAGGNRITTIGGGLRLDHTPEALLRHLAQELGYSLHKRAGRITKDPTHD